MTFLQLDLAREMWKDPSGSVFAMTGYVRPRTKSTLSRPCIPLAVLMGV